MTEATLPLPRGDGRDPPAALVLSALAGIERSATFRRSTRHRRLLRHLVQRTLDGAAGEIKESVLAAEVFGRDPAAFDPRSDTTVRVEVRRLRQKLDRYYADEGADAEVVVHLAAGSYVPRFEFRPRRHVPALAVLPFRHAGGSAQDDAAADALADALIDTLVQIPGLRIVARRSVSAWAQQSADVRTIGKALGVGLLLEGSVRDSDAGHRIGVQLVDAADGTHRWSRTFDARSLTAGDLVHRIAHGIVAALDLGDSAAAPLARVARRRTANEDAHDCWSRGLYLLRRHRADGFRQAMQLFAEALAHDPGFAPAWAGLGQAAVGLIGLSAFPDASLVATARDAAARALGLDPELAPAHSVESFLAFAIDRDFARAEDAILTALRYAPADAYVHHRYAWQLMFAGRFDEADAAFDTAIALDPLDPGVRTHRGLLWFYRRDYARAVQAFERVLEIEPSNIVARVLRTSAWLNAGAHDDALAGFRSIANDWPDDSIGPLGVVQALALMGRAGEARLAFDEMLARFGPSRVGPYRLAIAHARLRDADAAFAALDRAAELADMNLVCLAVDPSFDALRDLPQWHAALVRYRLPDIDPRAVAVCG
jgi:TolB-like protein/tetratricopeptide (TPR) repeat protein